MFEKNNVIVVKDFSAHVKLKNVILLLKTLINIAF